MKPVPQQEEDIEFLEIDPEVQAQLYRMAHGSTGIDPYDFVRILHNQDRLSERLDTALMVLPEAWGKAN